MQQNNQPRSIEKLLSIMMDHIYLIKHFQTGFCRLIKILYCDNIITYEESRNLNEYLSSHPPVYYKLKKFFDSTHFYWYPMGNVFWRKHWILVQLVKLTIKPERYEYN